MSLIVLGDRASDLEGWKAARRKVVTASDCVHLMGAADKHWLKTRAELAEEKLSTRDREPSARMVAGTFWEGPILDYFGQCYGYRPCHESRLIGHESLPFLACSPDAWLGVDPEWVVPAPRMPLEGFLSFYGEEGSLTPEEVTESLLGARTVADQSPYLVASSIPETARCLVEVKNQASKDRPKWNKAPPPYYYCQVQAQMAVIPLDFVLLVAKVDANELYAHLIRRDEFFIELLVDQAKSFYEEYLK